MSPRAHVLFTASHRGVSVLDFIIVVSVISLISLAALQVNSVPEKRGRDAERFSDIHTLSRALGLYALSTGHYPISEDTVALVGSDVVTREIVSVVNLPVAPMDPLSPRFAYHYQSDADGKGYTLTFCLETNSVAGYTASCTNTKKL